jgi:hypothetical protein
MVSQSLRSPKAECNGEETLQRPTFRLSHDLQQNRVLGLEIHKLGQSKVGHALCRRNAGEEKKVRTLAKSFASPPPELMMANAQSGVLCVYTPPPGVLAVDQRNQFLLEPGRRRLVTCATMNSRNRFWIAADVGP